ncbi:MAG: metallophosphoesterase [Myxococcales bacterium]|nr:metallophosphoesterase [Myxococcales bacterium]
MWCAIRTVWVMSLWLLLDGMLGLPAWAHGDPDHPDVSQPIELWGPLLSELSSSSFAIHVGVVDKKARRATLTVDDAAVRRAPSQPALRTVESDAATWHTLRIDGLSPGRRYRYQLLLDGLSPLAGELTTAPPVGDTRPLLLAVFGDEQASPSNDSVSSKAIVQAVLAESPDLVIGTGDLVGQGDSEADWKELSKTHAPLWSQLLYLPALGNHELIGDSDGSFFRKLLPQAEQRFYAVRYGFLQLIFLDGNRPGSIEQTQFLQDELTKSSHDPSVRARLVVLHQPPLSMGLHCGEARSMRAWMTLFEQHKVDAVLAGHDHAYERLERHGVPYFVSGGGGAKLYDRSPCGQPDEPALQRYESVHHYVMIELRPEANRVAITVRAQSPQGLPFDRVTLPIDRSAVGVIPSDAQGPPSRFHRGHLRYLIRHHGLQLAVALLFGAVIVVAWRYGRRRSS